MYGAACNSLILCNVDHYPLVVVIHWTRQIKEVLNSQESLEMTDGAGPLEEIQFWKARCDDLSGLTRQLDQAGVGRVISIMEMAKSSYLPPFTKLSKQIQVSCYLLKSCAMVCRTFPYFLWSALENIYNLSNEMEGST
mgnify:CR=1 FL=1